ncbi:type VII secretion protein EccE [Nocardia sp. NPDC004722]
MRKRRIRVGPCERGPFTLLVVGGGPLLSAGSGRVPWWVLVLAVVSALTLIALRLDGRTTARRLIDWTRYRRAHAAQAARRATPPVATDIEIAAGICGIHGDAGVLVAMIQLAPNLDLPSILAENGVYTEDTVPIGLLAPLLDQYGVAVDIEIVTTGRRTRALGDYDRMYEQLTGANPIVGERFTWLVIRLDQERNLAALLRRGPDAGPRALAAAAYRIATRLSEHAVPAEVLPAAALCAAARALHRDVELSDLTEHWRRLGSSVPGRGVTSFAVDWTRLGDTGFDDCWSRPRTRTTIVIALSGLRGPRALVRFVGPEVTDDVPAYLVPLPGLQSAALLASLPTTASIRELPLPGGPARLPADLAVPIGPNGQILGTLTGGAGRLLALPLFDPVEHRPRRRAVEVRATLPVAQQILLRTVVVGARVVIHTDRPDQWRHLVTTVNDPDALRLATESDAENSDFATATPVVEVFDRLPPRGSDSRATVTVTEQGTSVHRFADLMIEQVGDDLLDVGIPMRTVRVQLLEPRGETRFIEQPAPEEPGEVPLGPPARTPAPAIGT